MVDVSHISFAYGGSRTVLQDVSFHLERGQCLAILGNNGAGKSTLLKCIDRILPTKGGSVTIDGQNVFALPGREMARHIAFVAQESDRGSLTVLDTVLLGRRPYLRWDVTAHDRQIAMEAIAALGLEDYVLRRVSELSGGEFQKVMLARALAQEPKLLLLDEPTSSLDPGSQHRVLQTVVKLAREHNICVITVLHELNLALRYCDRYLFLKESQIYASGGREVMDPEIIEAVYGMHVHLETYMDIPVLIPFPNVKSHPTQEVLL